MARAKLPYREGTWFGVPLEDKSFAVGIVARMHRSGKVLFGYFFGPRMASLPSASQLKTLQPGEAILACQYGDLGLIRNWWPIICHQEVFSREDWPMPKFVRQDETRTALIEYRDDDLLTEVRCEVVAASMASGYPEDSLYGYEAVQIRLHKMLSS